ncbi:MAG: hypothetical protein ACXVWF_02055 [Actinomycetota bacterium]
MTESEIRASAERLWWDVKNVVSRYPSLAIPVARRRGHGVVVDAGTDVVIEGYPRSANSFAVAAFDMPQPRPLRIAHHTHAAAQIVEGCRLGVPTLVLVRDPDEAVLNTCIYHPFLHVRDALWAYVAFHDAIWPFRDRFVVGPFPEVTSDFGATMRRVNERYGTLFTPFEHTQENVRRCFDAMDTYWKEQVGQGETFERVVGRPSEWRDRERERLRASLDAPGLAKLRMRAEVQYRTLVAMADRSPA